MKIRTCNDGFVVERWSFGREWADKDGAGWWCETKHIQKFCIVPTLREAIDLLDKFNPTFRTISKEEIEEARLND